MSKAIESFGKYLLLERLAAGGMAEVYLSKSVGAGGIGKFVAIKRILPQYSDNEEFIAMFKEEAKLVMNLNHGNIVSIFDFGIERGQFFLVMEFVEGQNLRQVLNHMKKVSKYFTIDQIVHVAKEVASGLDHAHRCIDASTGRLLNITHRDMSPQNVMISFEGEVKVVDFGIAKAETQLENTRSGTIKGKFGYMSPEQAEGQIVDARTDIFSLGIVLWELLSQERLFTAANEHAVLKKIKECQIPPIRKINPAVHVDLERILIKSLTRDRNLRYQTAEAFAKDLSKFLNTHYADFSKQEFSKSMKQLYSDMYLENRKKLAEYAKVEIDSSTFTESTQGAKTKVIRPNDDLSSSALDIDSRSSHKVDLSKLVAEGGTKSYVGNISMAKINPLIASARQQQSLSKVRAKSSGSSSDGHTSVRPAQPPPSSSGSMGVFLVFLALIGGGAYLYMQNSNFRKLVHPSEAQLTAEADGSSGTELETANQASKTPPSPQTPPTPARVAMNVQSTPSGATVILDGQKIGLTPLISHIDTSKPFKLVLYREGYLPAEYTNEVATSDGYTRNVVMMPERSTGTILISTNSKLGPTTIVEINGQRVAQSLPYETKVSAGTPITIKIINPTARSQGEETVIIRPNEKKSLVIPINQPAKITD